jgi:hypothetical protein
MNPTYHLSSLNNLDPLLNEKYYLNVKLSLNILFLFLLKHLKNLLYSFYDLNAPRENSKNSVHNLTFTRSYTLCNNKYNLSLAFHDPLYYNTSLKTIYLKKNKKINN